MVKIIADSTCDLSKELIEKYDIAIIPLYVRLGDEEYLDGVNITPEKLYEWSDKTGQTPKTAAASVTDIMDKIKENEADEYVIFTISSSMSANYSNCKLAAQELDMEDKIKVIDSQNLSTGIGLQVIEACEMSRAGKSAAEIEEYILSLRSKVRASFVIDTLTYLYRGGRCSGLAALFGNALKLHPRIAVKDGAMGPEKKYRGLPKKYIMDYVKDMDEAFKNAKKDRVFITHSGCDKDIVEMVRSYLSDLGHFDEILETRAGGVVSSHCGPGTLGVLFIEK
ncbi:DegV family protein [Butyrivibrio sp. INlla21]|uniref:DegV family protein n=1 Tax=Butyrivibrio sp. INlla21 TaxID=1520811 RepID=UPI0008E503C7|nr:DegV family protein [Butyrivibrio sp. INlla21]SFU97821.1 EDD domain protein, DegV family [Butyrivibrio sp. INlla21]